MLRAVTASMHGYKIVNYFTYSKHLSLKHSLKEDILTLLDLLLWAIMDISGGLPLPKRLSS